MDRRVDARLDLKLPCSIVFPDSGLRLFSGVTENMSRSGILVRCSGIEPGVRLPKPGEALTAEVELPANHSFGRKCMHCQVTVVRVSDAGAGTAYVAFRIDQMQFRNYANGRFAHGNVAEELRRMVM